MLHGPGRQLFLSALYLSANCVAVMVLRSLRRRGSMLLRSTSSFSSQASTDYAVVLDQLFRAVKNPSRHTESSSSDELFARRKDFFSRVYAECGLKAKGPKVIHVAGSKGKGSTVEYIAAGLRGQGFKVGVFTSPHLHTARERIKVGTTLISKDDLTRLGNAALSTMYNLPWTVFFDLLLTTALTYFGEKKVDYLVLEAGIGGRYDSTNFLDANAVSVGVITSISLDHQSLLGNTIEEIAWQKAGIIKNGMHVFTPATQPPSVLQVFRDQAQAVGATLHEVPIDVAALRSDGLQLNQALHTGYAVQTLNACVSLAVVKHLGMPPVGMNAFFWPCRMDTFQLPGDVTVVLDGCHNGDSVALFLSGLRDRYPGRPLLALFGAGVEKCLDDMLSSLEAGLKPQQDKGDNKLLMVQSSHFRSVPEEELTLAARNSASPELGQRLFVNTVPPPQPNVKGGTVGSRLSWAVQHAQAQDQGRPVVAVFGSLFVAAEAREWVFSQHPELFSAEDWVRHRD